MYSAARELIVKNLDEPRRLGHVAIDRVGNFLGRDVGEVIGLPDHRPDIRHLPHQPLQYLGAAGIRSGQKLAGFFREMNQNRARLED